MKLLWIFAGALVLLALNFDKAEAKCLYKGKLKKPGDKWLTSGCSKLYRCTGKKFKVKNFKCPANSSCKNGNQCVCNKGYETKGKDKLNFKCKEVKNKVRCAGRFKRINGQCLQVVRGREDFMKARSQCVQRGGILHVTDNIFKLYKALESDKRYRGRNYFILGDRSFKGFSLASREKSERKSFISEIMMKYRLNVKILDRSLRRFYGSPKVEDWNYVSPLSSLCLAVTVDGPNLVKCNRRQSYICEQAPEKSDDKDTYWTSYFDVEAPNKKGSKESFKKILKKYNKQYNNKKDRLCKKPVQMECRLKGQNKFYSKKNTHGLVLKNACEKGKITCLNKKQKKNVRCPNFEVRFKCPKTGDLDNCSVKAVRNACEKRGRKCRNYRTGARCVKPKKKRDKSAKLGTSKCIMGSVTYDQYLCKATGDPHYTTFDGKRYNFMGTCSYDFVSTCNNFVPTENHPSFKIIQKNYKVNSKSTKSWTKGFQLTLNGVDYTFSAGKFSVNDIDVNPCGYADDNIKINVKPTGGLMFLVIETNFCLRIHWDNRFGLGVYLPSTYRNHVCGLCGNFDGKSSNDLLVPGSNRMMNANEINREFTVSSSFESVRDRCPIKVEEPKPCSKSQKAKLSKPGVCGVLDVNSKSPLVKAALEGADAKVLKANKEYINNEFNDCVNDMCWEPDTDRCHDLEEVIRNMNKVFNFLTPELQIEWRRYAKCEGTDEARCKKKANMVFKANAKVNCQATCANPDAEVECDDDNEEPSCICKEGFVLDAKMNCVPEDMCEKSCVVETDEGQTLSLNDGEKYVETPCELIKVCIKGKIQTQQLTPCSEHATCLKKGMKCRCNEGFIGNGYNCKTDLSCRKGYTAVGEKCYKFVPKKMDWHSAAINCGRDGSVLARFDDLVGEDLLPFFRKIPQMNKNLRALTKKVRCKSGKRCSLFNRYIGVDIKLYGKKKNKLCVPGSYKLAKDGKSIILSKKCRGLFQVKVIKASLKNVVKNFKPWIGGNSFVVDQKQRRNKEKFQIDPPEALDMSVFKDPHGCFQAMLSKKKKLIAIPNSKCSRKQTSICEYDNVRKVPHNPNDFKRLKVKGNYKDAEAACERMGRPLATVGSKEQGRIISTLVRKLGGDAWIGGRYNDKKKKFIMSDNKPIRYSNWRKREPNNFNENKRSDEKCIAVQRNGQWFTDNCNEQNYAICGPPSNMEPASFTAYYKPNGFSSIKNINVLRMELYRNHRYHFICDNPIAVECRAKEKNSDEYPWITHHEKKGRNLICKKNKFQCRRKKGFDCRTFRVRFLCPKEENQCVELKKENINPCNGGKVCIPVRNHYICRCPHGTEWDKKLQKCHAPCGVCSASGDPHYTTFSGMKYDFMGTCMYKFAGNCDLDELKKGPTFDVYTKNEKCGKRGASCIYGIEVHLRNIAYKKNGKNTIRNFVFKVSRKDNKNFLYNNKKTKLGEVNVPGAVHVVRKVNYFSLTSEALGLKVLFSGAKLIVNMPNKFVNKMCGLCGDCNTDKLRMKDLSLIEIPKKNKRKYDNTKIIPFANEWIVPYPGNDPKKCKIVKPLPECAADVTQKLSQPNMCGIFKDPSSSIAPCYEKVDPIQFYEDCLVDACNDDAVKSVCRAVKVYAQACLTKGIVLDWRRENFCPIDCKEKVYSPDASCEPMCGRDVNPNAVCDEEPEEGCICPSGYMKSGDECVKPEKCGCEVLDGDEQTILVPPGESRLLSGCEEIAKCIVNEDGTTEEIRESISLDPNAVCKDDPEPTIDCARGYILQADGKTCKRDLQDCAKGFGNFKGICVQGFNVRQIWSQAIGSCNDNDGTLTMINSAERLNSFKDLLKQLKFKRSYISGQVKVLVSDDNKVNFEPVLSKQKQGKIEYYNFDFKLPENVVIRLSKKLNAADLKGKNVVLGLVFTTSKDGKVIIEAVPKDTEEYFVCEERYVKPEEETWFGPCNSDSDMQDGDFETSSTMRNKCLVCPVPMEVRCNKVDNAPGTATGECKMTNKEVYYSCDKGKDCIDHNVETKCAKDIDECAEGLHDCPASSECHNTVGAYRCVCDRQTTPLMIKGQCYSQSQCTIQGSTSDVVAYKQTGFSFRSGIFLNPCSMNFAETCKEKFDVNSNLPRFSVGVHINRKKGTRTLMGSITTTGSNETQYFIVTAALLKQAKFLYGESFDTATEHNIGFGCSNAETYFTQQPNNQLYIQHFSYHFQILVKYPFDVVIVTSSAYNNMLCGSCRLKPRNNKYYVQTLAERIEISKAWEHPSVLSKCGPQIVEEPTTTQAPSTTTPKVIIDPTEQPTPTPQVPACDDEEVNIFCQLVSKSCAVDAEDCSMDVCGYPSNKFCHYLLTSAKECKKSPEFSRMIREKLNNCEGVCTEENMNFEYTGGQRPESCQVAGNGKSFPFLSSYGCRCEDGYKLSGQQCVPKIDCGCSLDDGTYLEKGTIYMSEGCKYTLTCLGNNMIKKTPGGCQQNSICTNTPKGRRCKCKKGMYGNGQDSDGCKTPVKEDDTKICYDIANEDGMTMTTCSCKRGFGSNCTACVDINECNEDTHDCDLSKEKCENVPGSFKCSCAVGFVPLNGECKDIDECKNGQARCGQHEGCVNTPGSYECTCCSGFKYDLETRECKIDFQSGVNITVKNPKCCLECDNAELCQSEKPYCATKNGIGSKFSSYKQMFLFHCVNNLKLASFQEGPCPKIQSTESPKPTSPGTTTGSGSTTLPDGQGENGENPSSSTPPAGAQTPPLPKSCFDPEFCRKIPPPPPSISSGPVCGPSNLIKKITFPNYCAMVRAVCQSNGGVSIIPKTPIAAEPGVCPLITPTPPPTPPQPETSAASSVTEPTSAPDQQTTRQSTTVLVEPSEPVLTDWSPWSRCRVDNNAMPCGRGKQSRSRNAVPYDDEKDVKPVQEDELYEDRVCFKPCDPTDDSVGPEICEDPGICGDVEEKLCGSFGAGAAKTFDNECELNVAACQAKQRPNIVKKGECEEAPKALCRDGPEEIVAKRNVIDDEFKCVQVEAIFKRCTSRVCPGGYSNCCQATKYEKISVTSNCFDASGQLRKIKTFSVLSAVDCKCSEGDD